MSFLYLGDECCRVMYVVVGGDAMKINGVRAKPLIFVKLTYLIDIHKYM